MNKKQARVLKTEGAAVAQERPLMAPPISPSLTAEVPRSNAPAAKKGTKRKSGRRYEHHGKGGADPDLEAEQRREGLLEGVYIWQGVELEPYTKARQTLWRLVRTYWPRPAARGVLAVDALDDDEVLEYVPWAWVMLYLCAHPPEVWRPWQSQPERWIEEVEAWAEENVPAGEEYLAVGLAFKMINDVREMVAVARRQGPTGGK